MEGQSREERAEERRYWETFKPKLTAIETFDQARELALDYPPPGKPGRLFHMNLLFVLQHSTAPNDSSSDERVLFRVMFLHFVQSRQLAAETFQRYEESLRIAPAAKVLPY